MRNINLNCPINSTGYGITSLNIAKALIRQDLNIALFNIGNRIEVNSHLDKTIVEKAVNNSLTFDYNAPCLKIWHQYDLASKIGNGHYYTFPFFEIDKISQREKHCLNYSDYIFVASQWGKDILVNNGVTRPIYVAPLGVDSDIFKPPVRIRMQKPSYIFFHIGKWELRKSHDFLIHAFNTAFDIDDDVELWLLPSNPFLSAEETKNWTNLVENSKLASKIRIFDRQPTQYHIAEFIDACDCGVFLSRAEGWNNEIIESMAMNKPVIVTNYSAHTEYSNKDNSFLVDIESIEPANDSKWFHGEGNWAKLGQKQLDQTVHYMKYVYSNHIEDNPAGLLTAKKYSWDRTAGIIVQTLDKHRSFYANTKTKTKRR